MRMWIVIGILMCWGLSATAQDSYAFSQDHSDNRRRYDMMFLEAICLREKGENDAAFDLLRHCVAIDSTRSEAWFYLSQYYAALKEKDQSLNCIRHAAMLEPENSTYVETLAQMYLRQRNYQLAAQTLEQLYEKNRDRDDVVGMLVQLYEQLEDYDKAIDALSRFEVMEGKSERLSYAKSQFYTQKGDKKAAIAEMKQLSEQYPNDLSYRCLYANSLYQNGQQKKGVALYQKILQEEPDNRLAQLAMLTYYHDQKDSLHERQITQQILVNKNITLQDRVALMRQIIADSEQHGGDSTRVLQLFHQMLSMPEAESDIAIFCATYMNLKKMPHDSIKPVLERALEIAPDNATARLQLVSYAWQAEDRDRVIALCREARQYNPDEMAFYYYQGIAYYQKQQLDDALNAFQNGISVINEGSDPEIVSDFYAVMGDIMHQRGRTQEAFAAYDSCLQWKEDNIGCLNNYAYYLSELGQQLDKAEQMSYRTIKAEPKNATYLDTYAWILFMQKRYNEARIYIDQTLQCDSDSSAVLLEHAGDIYYFVGDTDKAVSLWQLALGKSTDQQQPGTEDRRAILTRKVKLKKYFKE